MGARGRINTLQLDDQMDCDFTVSGAGMTKGSERGEGGSPCQIKSLWSKMGGA